MRQLRFNDYDTNLEFTHAQPQSGILTYLLNPRSQPGLVLAMPNCNVVCTGH